MRGFVRLSRQGSGERANYLSVSIVFKSLKLLIDECVNVWSSVHQILLTLLYILPQAVYTFRLQSWLIRGVERAIEGIVLLPSISKKASQKQLRNPQSFQPDATTTSTISIGLLSAILPQLVGHGLIE